MIPYEDLELSVEPEPVHVEEEPRSGMVIVYLLLAAAIAALLLGARAPSGAAPAPSEFDAGMAAAGFKAKVIQ